MNELIKVTSKVIGSEEINAVDARELWIFLESKREFATWIKTKIERYKFVDGEDYALDKNVGNVNQADSWPIRKQRIDYSISIDMAKELAMVENNKKGRDARKYFIRCEKDLKDIQRIDMPEWEKEELAIERFMKRLNVAPHLIPVESTKYVHSIGGPDLREIVGELPSSQNILDEEVMLEPTELGKELGFSAIRMNKTLEELGLQTKENKKWVPTNKGAQICSRHLWNSCGKSGYNYKWNLNKVKELME